MFLKVFLEVSVCVLVWRRYKKCLNKLLRIDFKNKHTDSRDERESFGDVHFLTRSTFIVRKPPHTWGYQGYHKNEYKGYQGY